MSLRTRILGAILGAVVVAVILTTWVISRTEAAQGRVEALHTRLAGNARAAAPLTTLLRTITLRSGVALCIPMSKPSAVPAQTLPSTSAVSTPSRVLQS